MPPDFLSMPLLPAAALQLQQQAHAGAPSPPVSAPPQADAPASVPLRRPSVLVARARRSPLRSCSRWRARTELSVPHRAHSSSLRSFATLLSCSAGQGLAARRRPHRPTLP